MRAIAAVSDTWGIGKDNDLLFSIPEDMKHFRETTKGGIVIMGRRTLDSLPGGNPLPKRRNIVITRSRAFQREGVEVAHSVEEALLLVKQEPQELVWVIGGGEIYTAFLPYCSECIITRVHASRSCDAFFPDLDKMADWGISESSDTLESDGISYEFVTYKRI